MVRPRKPNPAPGRRKVIANSGPTADPEEGASLQEGETSNNNANNNKVRNKKGKLVRSPEIVCSASEEGSQKVSETSHIATRSSTRQVKKVKRADSPTTPTVKAKDIKESKTTHTPETAKNNPAKSRRPWELWTANDKKLFFEGLFQYGKDFDAIQDFIQKKVGKKTQPHLIKNKDQVRYFYYRTWNKIQKFVNIDDNVEKSTQELYGLINFGELRKRVGPGLKLDQKTGPKFRELVHNGLTTIKFRGKNYRLRTPVCRALKVLNNLGEGEKEQRLSIPENLIVELKPKNSEAWSYVQSCSHNPHVKMAIKPSRQMSTIFSYLEKRWKTPDDKLREKLEGFVVKAEKELRISVPKDSNIYPVTFKTADAQPRLGVTLENYKENLKGVPESPSQKLDGNKLCEDTTSGMCANNSPSMDVDEDYDGDEMPCILKEKQTVSKTGHDETSNIDSTKSSPRTVKEVEPDLNKERVLEGWTANSVKTLTAGEIFLILGNPKRLILEYEWCDIKVDKFQLLTLNNMLRRLVHLASSQLMDVSKEGNSPSRLVCKCGKTGTPSSNKSPANARSPAVAKDPSTPRGRRVQASPVGVRNARDDSLFIAPSSLPPKAPPSPKPGEPVKTLDGNHFLQQLDSLKPSKHKMRNRMNRRPFLVQRRLLPKAQAVALAMFPNAPVNTIRPAFVPVIPGQSVSGLTTRTVISPVTVATPNVMPTRLISQGNDIANIISAAASQSGIRVAQTPPKVMGGRAATPTSHTTTTMSSSGLTGTTTKRRITPIPVYTDGTQSPLSNPTSPFATVSAQQMSSPLATAPLGHLPAVSPPLGEMQVSDVLHQLASDLTSVTTTIPTDTIKSSIEPPSITSFLDISLPATEISESTDRLIDSFCGLLDSSGITNSTANTKSSSSAAITSSGNTQGLSHQTTPPGSPNRSPLKISSPGPLGSWFNGDDFSLSSFLTESPQKRTTDLSTPSTNNPLHFSELSRDVDTTFQNMLNESSVDYVSKFADIAAQLAASKNME